MEGGKGEQRHHRQRVCGSRGESTFEGLSENQHGWNQGSKAKLTRFKMRLLERQSADHSRSC